MKRLICLVLAFVIFFGICGIIAPDINNIYKLKEADSFAEQVNVLVKQYESRQDTQNRLIVNSNKIKESYGAVKVIKAHGFQVMQFKDYESAESAKAALKSSALHVTETILPILRQSEKHRAQRIYGRRKSRSRTLQ